jgi:hypothetical protein
MTFDMKKDDRENWKRACGDKNGDLVNNISHILGHRSVNIREHGHVARGDIYLLY